MLLALQTLGITLATITAVVNCGAVGSEPVNNRPIFGVLLQEEQSKPYQYMLPSYVKWLEASGARVVPIYINQAQQYYVRLTNQINGVLMPGGGRDLLDSGFARAADTLLDLALAKNANGTWFPVWGTCLGFQKKLTYFTGDRLEWKIRCNVTDVQLPLDIPAEAKTNSRMLTFEGSKTVLDLLSTKPVTPNHHSYCVSQQYFEANHNLTEQFRVVSTNTYNNVTFVSSFEHRKYPIYATQWHPEKNTFEWEASFLTHSLETIQVGQYFGNFLVNEARKNEQHFANKTEEVEALIYNFSQYLVYTGREKSAYFTQIYRFPIKM